METDFASIVIGLASIAIFLVPIGYYQVKEKSGVRKAKQQFMSLANDIGFQAGEIEVLRNRAVIGIDSTGEELLYVKDDEHQIAELVSIDQAAFYKSKQIEEDERGKSQNITEMGVRLKMRGSPDLKLCFFRGRDGTQVGDERIIIQGWIHKIESAKKELKHSIV